MYNSSVNYKHRLAWWRLPVVCLTRHHAKKIEQWTYCRFKRVTWTARAQLQLSLNKKLPQSGRKGSFEGHWSGSYCPGGRQIGSVKPHWESDWNWFVVLLLHHPIKRINSSGSARERRGGGKGGRELGKMRAKGPWLGHGTLMVPVKQGEHRAF